MAMQQCAACANGRLRSVDPLPEFALCPACSSSLAQASDPGVARELLDRIDAPVLLMRSNPRQVVSANRKAMALFGKDRGGIEGRRGGDVFDCRYSFTPAGCGKDAHCEPCSIKAAIVATFKGISMHAESPLQVRRDQAFRPYRLRISTTSAGEFALVRIDFFGETAPFDPAAAR